MRKLLTKKDKGNPAASAIYILLGMVAILMVTMLGMSYLHTVEKASNAENVIHAYMLEMESTGGLDSNMVQNIKEDLRAFGFENVSVTGTFKPTESNYGQPIRLTVTGDLHSVVINASGKTDKVTPLTYTKVGTSKWIT